MSTRDYRNHLRSLAREAGFRICWLPRRWNYECDHADNCKHATTDLLLHRVYIPHPVNQTNYFVGLHELGHAFTSTPLDLSPAEHFFLDVVNIVPRQIQDREIEAWRWALAHSLEYPSSDTADILRRALTSYQVPSSRIDALV